MPDTLDFVEEPIDFQADPEAAPPPPIQLNPLEKLQAQGPFEQGMYGEGPMARQVTGAGGEGLTAAGSPLKLAGEIASIPFVAGGKAIAALGRAAERVPSFGLGPIAPPAPPRRPTMISPTEIRPMTEEEQAEREPIQVGRPLIPPRLTQLEPQGTDAARLIGGLSTPEGIAMLAGGMGSRLLGYVVLAQMAPQVLDDVKTVASSSATPEEKRDRINNLVLPVVLGLRHTGRARPGGPDFTQEMAPLEFTGGAIPGLPRGATPLRPTAGPERLGPPIPPAPVRTMAEAQANLPGGGAVVTAPEAGRGESIIEEIKRRNLNTNAKILEAFPDLKTRPGPNEQAARLRRAAFGPIQGPPLPPGGVVPQEPPARVGIRTGLPQGPEQVVAATRAEVQPMRVENRPVFQGPEQPQYVIEQNEREAAMQREVEARRSALQQNIIFWERELEMAQNRGDKRGQDKAAEQLLLFRREYESIPPVKQITPKPPLARAPGRPFRPTVPGTPAQEQESVLAEIRRRNLRTRNQVIEAFPGMRDLPQASEKARDLLRLAWPQVQGPPLPPTEPPAAPPGPTAPRPPGVPPAAPAPAPAPAAPTAPGVPDLETPATFDKSGSLVTEGPIGKLRDQAIRELGLKNWARWSNFSQANDQAIKAKMVEIAKRHPRFAELFEERPDGVYERATGNKVQGPREANQPRARKIVSAAYVTMSGKVETGANHPAILKRLGIGGFETRESRNNPNFGFMLDDGTFIRRDEAGPIAKASGQNLEDFEEGEQVHSDQIESPTEPGTPLGDVPQRLEDTMIAGKTLGEWEAIRDASQLPKGNERAALAKWLAVPNQPARILQALGNKKRTREIHAPPATEVAPVQPAPAAAPTPEAPPTAAAPVTPPAPPIAPDVLPAAEGPPTTPTHPISEAITDELARRQGEREQELEDVIKPFYPAMQQQARRELQEALARSQPEEFGAKGPAEYATDVINRWKKRVEEVSQMPEVATAPAKPSEPTLTPKQLEAKSQELDRLVKEKRRIEEEQTRLIGLRDAAEEGSKKRTTLSEQVLKTFEDLKPIDKQIDDINRSGQVFDYRWAKETAKFRGQVEPEPGKPQITAKVLKAQRENLLQQVDQAIKDAPESGTKKVLLSVPGDGDFNIINNKESLKEFRAIVAQYFPKDVSKGGTPSIPSGKGKTMPKAVPPADADLPAIGVSAVSTDETRFAIQTGYADGTQIISTDGRQLLRIVTDKAPGTPAAPVRLDEKGKVTESDSNYPNYNQIISESPDLVKGGADTAQLWQLSNQALVIWKGMEDKESASAKLYVNPDGSLGLSSKRGATGDEYSSNIQDGAKWVGDYNPNFLLDAADVARRLGNEKVDFYVYGETGPLEVRGKNHQHIVMPMRMSEGLAAIRDNPNSFTPGQKVSGSLPTGFGPLRNPESFLQEVVTSGSTKYAVSLEGGKFKVEQNFPKVGQYGSERWENVASFPLDESTKAKVTEALTKEGKLPSKDLVNRVLSAVGNLQKERRGIIEEGQSRMPSKGPGAAAAAEFEEGNEPPDPEVMGLKTGNPFVNEMDRRWRNLFSGFGQLSGRGATKKDIALWVNEMDTIPNMTGQQAGNSFRLMLDNVRQQRAVTALMQALKMSGQGLSQEDAERLGELEFAGDPQGYLRAKQTDMETLAQTRLNDGKRLEAQAAKEWAVALFDARQQFNQLKPIAQDAKRRLDQQLKREAAAGVDTAYENWYVPQRWDFDLLPAANRPIVIGGQRGGAPSTSFRKAKYFEDYATGLEAGHIPRTFSIADLMEHRVRSGEKLIARKAMFQKLKAINDPLTGDPIAMNIPRRVIERPDGSTDVQETVPRDYEPVDVIPGVRLAIHKGYARGIRAMTGTSQISESAIVGSAQNLAAIEKHLGLALDTFHLSRTLQAEFFLTHRMSLPFTERLTRGAALVEYAAADLDRAVQKGVITQGMADWITKPQDFNVNGRDVQMSPKAVVNLGAHSGLAIARVADAIYKDWIRAIPLFGDVNRIVFDKVTRSAMSHGFISEFDRISRSHPEWDGKTVAKKVASDINVLFGNLQKESWIKSPSLNAILQIAFLAPNWVQSLIRREGRAAIQIGQAGVGVAKGEGFRIGSAGKAMGEGIAAYIVATQVLNLITRGHLTFQNEEEGHKFDAYVPNPKQPGTGFFISPLSVFGEITHDLIRYAQTKPDIASALSQMGANKLGNLGRAVEVLATGRDPFDQHKLIGTANRLAATGWQLVPWPITLSGGAKEIAGSHFPDLVNRPSSGQIVRQAASSLGFKIEPAPSAQNQVRALADQWKSTQEPKVASEVTRRLQEDFGPSNYRELRHALANNQPDQAQKAYRALREEGKTPELIRRTIEHPHPFAGSRALEGRFLDSLTPQQEKLYEKALQEREELINRFEQMLDTKPQLQEIE